MTDAVQEMYYARPDSCYIRIKFIEEQDGFKFDLCNETDGSNNAHHVMLAVATGVLHLVKNNPSNMYQLGLQVLSQQEIDKQIEKMPEEHQKLINEPPQGSA